MSLMHTRRNAGFTLIELMITVTTVSFLALTTIPSIRKTTTNWKTRRVAGLIADDLSQAVALAGRQRKPVRISCDCDHGIYRLTDRTSGTVLLSRSIGPSTDFGIATVAFSATAVDVYPAGFTSLVDTVTITAGDRTRKVVMTTAGQVRIVP